MDLLANKHIKITDSTIKIFKSGVQSNKTQIRNIHTLNKNLTRDHFTPLKNDLNLIPNDFATMDIETINLNNNQIPIVITSYIPGVGSKLFIIKNIDNLENSINNLWKEYFDYIINNFNGVIFVHNLGAFDGYFIFKHLSNIFKPTQISSIIDDKNKFIQISLDKKII
jgi:uncharacterized protein YprB with RNaseH-like and TPR domain